MREAQYTAAVKKLLDKDVYALKLNCRYTAGVPDSYYSGRAADLWVEWKYLQHIPPRLDLIGGKNPIITKLQQAWLSGRHEEGRNVVVIVGSPEGGVVFHGLSWIDSISRSGFLAYGLNKHGIAAVINSICLGT